MDCIYGVNVDPLSPKVGIQIIQFLSQLGHYKLPDGKDDFECTTRMIDTIMENIKTNIVEMTKFEKVDLAIALMVIPVPTVAILINELLSDISENDFVVSCYELVMKTNFFEIYVVNDEEKINKTDYSIEIISIYLKGIAGKHGITGEQFRNKFNEIQTILCKDSNHAWCDDSREPDFGMF